MFISIPIVMQCDSSCTPDYTTAINHIFDKSCACDLMCGLSGYGKYLRKRQGRRETHHVCQYRLSLKPTQGYLTPRVHFLLHRKGEPLAFVVGRAVLTR